MSADDIRKLLGMDEDATGDSSGLDFEQDGEAGDSMPASLHSLHQDRWGELQGERLVRDRGERFGEEGGNGL